MIEDIGRLLVSCPDRPGIVAAISTFLRDQGANITQSDQYSTDPEGGTFFLRTVFHLSGFDEHWQELGERFRGVVADKFGMWWQLTRASQPKRLAIMVSREDHCLLDLLWRSRRGELPAIPGVVVSNHPELAEAVAQFGVPFEQVPLTPETKEQAEERQLELLARRYDVIVLARYMQILSPEFLDRIDAPLINIHHSFLPAFVGADPYRRAKERGVKLIGATAHYVTAELDQGPIIEQDVVRVSHRDDVESLARQGADIERTVLVRAVRAHCEDRVLLHGGTTIVF